jgi:hypothetical protein
MLSRVRLLSAVVIFCFLLVGCGGQKDDTFQGGAPTQSENVTPNVVGFVVRVNPVFLVASLDDAPPGASPLAGALVTARNYNGSLLGAAVTADDGSFSLDNLPTGGLTIEARIEPDSAEPDAVANVTAVADAVVLVNEKFTVDREQAVDIALRGVGGQSLVAASMNPLPAGTVVSPSETDPDEALTLDSPTWFFLVYLNPGDNLGLFTQSVEYRLVDAETGALTTTVQGSFPLINDFPLFFRTKEILDFAPIDVSSPDFEDFPPGFEPTPRPEIVKLPDTPLLFGQQPVTVLNQAQTDNSGVFAVLLANCHDDRAFSAGVNKMRSFLISQGVPPSNIYALTYDDLYPDAYRFFKFSVLAPPDFQNSLFMYDSLLAARHRAAIKQVNEAINARLRDGKESTFISYITSHGSNKIEGKGLLYSSTHADFSADTYFDRGLVDSACAKIRVLTDSCYADRLHKNLAEHPRVTNSSHDFRYFSATDSTHPCGLQRTGGNFTNVVTRKASLVNGELEGLLESGFFGESLIQELQDLEHGFPHDPPPVGKGLSPDNTFKQNPVYRQQTGQDCSTVEVPSAGETDEVNTKSRVTVVNRSKTPITFQVTARDHEFNQNRTIRLLADQTFTDEVEGPILDLALQRFGSRTFLSDFLFLTNKVPQGVEYILIWTDDNGSRLSTAIGPSDPLEDGLAQIDASPNTFMFEHCVGISECPQLAGEITVRNTGGVPVTLATSVPLDSGLEIRLKPGFEPDIGLGDEAVFEVEFICDRDESYDTDIQFIATKLNSSDPPTEITVPVRAVIKYQAVRLEHPLGTFLPGTDIRLSRIVGGDIDLADVDCPEDHYNGTITSVDENTAFSGPDPAPNDCGWGKIVKTEGGTNPPPLPVTGDTCVVFSNRGFDPVTIRYVGFPLPAGGVEITIPFNVTDVQELTTEILGLDVVLVDPPLGPLNELVDLEVGNVKFYEWNGFVIQALPQFPK